MFRLSVLVAFMILGSVVAGVAAQEASPVASDGGSIVARFDPGAGEFPEGVAVASDGTVYASLSPLGQLVRLVPGGGFEVVGTIAGLQEGDFGMLGLAASADGAVYGAVVSANDAARGVWRFDVVAGTAERVPGTEAIAIPNSIAIDSQGALYVTDSFGGAVWRVLTGGTAEQWVQHELLTGTTEVPIGANGIALDEAAGTIYVAVSPRGTLVAIPIQANGSAGEPAIHTEFTNDQGFIGVDGIARDGAGNIYVTQPMANAVVRVSPDGTIAPVATVADGLDGPTSVAIGPNADGVESLFVASWSDALGDFAPPDGEEGPCIVAITLDRVARGRPVIGDW